MQQLPSDYRDVNMLHHLEGLSFAEVARRMKRSLDSVKKLWIRALVRLRDSLENC
jgi:RNA polymerase sigma-70 factor (ECF subfamily)